MAIKYYAGDRITCLSSDVKPTGVVDGAFLSELDTNINYIRYSGIWNICFSGEYLGTGDLVEYIVKDGSKSFTGTISGITPTDPNHLATKGYIDGIANTLDSSLTAHIEDTDNPHSVSASQVGAPSLGQFTLLSGDYSGHTGDNSVHFTQSEISITESQISDLQSYALAANLAALSGLITGHTGDSSIHFTQAQINITASQISDFSESVQDIFGTNITGLSGIHVEYKDASNILEISFTGTTSNYDHGALTGLTDDDHTIYLTKNPQSSTRNSIAPSTDNISLTINPYLFPTTDSFVVNDTITNKIVWVDLTGRLNILNNPITAYNAINLNYLSSNYITISTFTGYTGNLNIPIPVDARNVTGSIVPEDDGLWSIGTALKRYNNIHTRVSTFGDTYFTVVNDEVATSRVNISGADSDSLVNIYQDYLSSASSPAITIWNGSSETGLIVNFSGDIYTYGSIYLQGSDAYITGVRNPTASGHAANKFYVDLAVALVSTELGNHTESANNPHFVTAFQIGATTTGEFVNHTGDVTLHLTTPTGNAAGSNFGSGAGNIVEGSDSRLLSLQAKEYLTWSIYDSWWKTSLNGFTQSNIGSAISYVALQRYQSFMTGNNLISAATVEGSTATVGTHASLLRTNGTIQLVDGRWMKMRCAFNGNIGFTNRARIGFAGNSSTPIGTDVNITGVYFEYDSSLSANWRAVCVDSAGNQSGIDLGITVSGTRFYELLIYNGWTFMEFYIPSETNALLGTITGTSLLNASAAEANTRWFMQIFKDTAAGASNPNMYCEYFGFTNDLESRWTLL